MASPTPSPTHNKRIPTNFVGGEEAFREYIAGYQGPQDRQQSIGNSLDESENLSTAIGGGQSRKRKAQIGPDGKVTKRKTLDEKSDAESVKEVMKTSGQWKKVEDLQAEVKQLKREEDVSEYQAWVFGEEMPDERKKLFEAADNHTGAQDNHIQGLENTANDQALQIKQLMQERNAARNANQLSKGSG